MNPTKTKLFNHQQVSALIEDYQQNLPTPMTEELGKIVSAMVRLALCSNRFKSYSPDWKLEMESEGRFHILKYIKNYNPTKCTDIYNYFYKICHNAFVQVLNKKKASLEQDEFYDDTQDDNNLEHALSELPENRYNREQEGIQKTLKEVFFRYLESDDSIENRFLIKLLYDSMFMEEKAIKAKYSIKRQQIKNYKADILRKLKKFVKKNQHLFRNADLMKLFE